MLSNSISVYLNYQETAKAFGISLGTLYAMVSKKQIPHIRLGNRFVRFSREELEKFFKAHQINPVSATAMQSERGAK